MMFYFTKGVPIFHLEKEIAIQFPKIKRISLGDVKVSNSTPHC
jgi:hypothetical protein